MSNKSIFTDVPATDKYYKVYKWCVDNGLLHKSKDGKFKPTKTMTKKNVAIVLYRFYKLLKKKNGGKIMPSYPGPHDPSGLNEPSFMTNLYGASWSGAWNTCIYGSPVVAGANVLANCVGYAQGRMLDIWLALNPTYNPSVTMTHPFVTLNGEPYEWIARARAAGLTVQNEPRAGSVLVTNSHVAVVESYDEATGLWMVSESGYGGPAYSYGSTIYKSGNTWYSSFASDHTIVGFILIPDVPPGPGPGPGPTPGGRGGYDRRRRFRNL